LVIDAILKEFCQLHDKGVFEPHLAHTLSPTQRRGALCAVNLIKEKRSGEVKGRTCADGSVQKNLFDRADTTSPTVATDSLMYTLLIDAKERRDVATADVVGAYLNANMDTFSLMKLSGEAVEIMIQVEPKYKNFVSMEKGKQVLYLQLMKALYGCVKSALLWYELFTSTLQDMGFELNPYDACVANKLINGSQCTVVWYVDANKISHVDPKVVTNVIEKIEQKFGKMTVTRGNSHTFLGMNFTINDNKTVTISMKTYLQEAITESGIDITRQATSPAGKGLFELDDKSPLLEAERSDKFHSIVAKLLYVATRSRPDLLLAVSFLCTRVAKSTEQDRKKLQRLLEYISGTLDLTLTLGADILHTIRTWVDASYAVHPDMRSHTGGVMSLGTGAVICKSSKQKINTKSSTEAELVGATDYLPNMIWSKMFLEAQGHPIQENIFEQDNESAMRLERNSRASAGKQSRHINIRYFFMKDRIKSDDINLRHCPTTAMLADFLTKPLQGSLFRKFRDVMLGYQHTNTLGKIGMVTSNVSSTEEHVGERVNEDEEDENNEENYVQCSDTDDKFYEKIDKEIAGESTTANDNGTWSLVVVKKKGKKKNTSDPHTKIVNESVYKSHNFVNDPTPY
jgi:Reverse transcriptase (RNA-dependent DNA polymerase)